MPGWHTLQHSRDEQAVVYVKSHPAVAAAAQLIGISLYVLLLDFWSVGILHRGSDVEDTDMHHSSERRGISRSPCALSVPSFTHRAAWLCSPRFQDRPA